MMKRILMTFMLTLLFATGGCFSKNETGSPLTSTGNPNLGPNTYINKFLRVAVKYPESWNVAEGEMSESQGVVTFSDPDPDGTTTAVMTFSKLDPQPSSLQAYLESQFPQFRLQAFSASGFDGFLYDDDQLGQNGGDLRRYFLLKDAILIDTNIELFLKAEAELLQLLDGIIFF